MALIGEETQVTQLSPMMQQYMQVKEQHKDHILFFRLGDFYEMFFDDALLVSKELELTLTGRDCGLPERAPMCGVPYHSCDAYIARLIKKGYKVAICEQMEDPKSAKGLVKRDVIRVITPGTLIETNMLEEGVNNFIASIYLEGECYGVAVADISTGEIHLTQFQDSQDETIKNEISRFAPSEIVFNTAFLSKNHIASFIKERLSCCAECLDDSAYAQDIMSTPLMVEYNAAKQEMDEALTFVNQIIIGSVNGEDPDTIEPMEMGCGGNCASCQGCH